MAKTKIVTHFSNAWYEYKQTEEYKKQVDFLKNKKMNQPYIDNVIFLSFTAGYNAKKHRRPGRIILYK